MNLLEFRRGMAHYFQIEQPYPFIEQHGSYHQQVCLDLIRFDEWLHEQCGDYEDEQGISMAECIERRYGKKARQFVQLAFRTTMC